MEVKDYDIQTLCQIFQEVSQDVIDEMPSAVNIEMLDKQWAVFRSIVQIASRVEMTYDTNSGLGFGIRVLNREAEVYATNNYNRRLAQLQKGAK